MKKTILLVALSIGTWSGAGFAQGAPYAGLKVTGHIAGYECMGLRDGFQEATWDQLPRVRSEPRANATQVGIATANVIVKSPHVARNGYLEVMHLDGRPGWVDQRVLVPWVNDNAPGVRCVPAMMSNGRLGFDYIRPPR
ncbi:MAG: SH3 domain-containing protein [Roseomonas mucosa]|uniref:SH3 domain-containing protein n=1 Tax=Roseomonas TaxID=125216 RepID=UPI000B04ADFB|nr:MULTISPECIES: SH3 domain-containing protein [Roseomonas]MCG7354823.1 SH3 domain-containing protein [Roseomonas mucosa]MDT8362974.1 SH3 domain-containing protein [Roseomonas mucosa]MDU7519822.1 SH3 domain-containing protein [Roseomonas mucosa]QDD96938.1 Hypothetical protein ADP8_03929 [Roseomonas mucosa]